MRAILTFEPRTESRACTLTRPPQPGGRNKVDGWSYPWWRERRLSGVRSWATWGADGAAHAIGHQRNANRGGFSLYCRFSSAASVGPGLPAGRRLGPESNVTFWGSRLASKTRPIKQLLISS